MKTKKQKSGTTQKARGDRVHQHNFKIHARFFPPGEDVERLFERLVEACQFWDLVTGAQVTERLESATLFGDVPDWIEKREQFLPDMAQPRRKSAPNPTPILPAPHARR